MGAATAAALVAGSATLTMAAPRGVHRVDATSAHLFHWQTFTPGHLVRIETPKVMGGSAGDLHTEGLRSAMTFSWQAHTPGHLAQNQRPNGMGSAGAGDTQTDPLRASANFAWQSFTPGHLVHRDPSNGLNTATPGDLHTDAMRSGSFRPALVFDLGHDDAGGVRAAMGLSFRVR